MGQPKVQWVKKMILKKALCVIFPHFQLPFAPEKCENDLAVCFECVGEFFCMICILYIEIYVFGLLKTVYSDQKVIQICDPLWQSNHHSSSNLVISNFSSTSNYSSGSNSKLKRKTGQNENFIDTENPVTLSNV